MTHDPNKQHPIKQQVVGLDFSEKTRTEEQLRNPMLAARNSLERPQLMMDDLVFMHVCVCVCVCVCMCVYVCVCVCVCIATRISLN